MITARQIRFYNVAVYALVENFRFLIFCIHCARIVDSLSTDHHENCLFNIQGEEWEIMRGTWYYDGSWIPLEPEDARVIEEVHLRLFEKTTHTPPNSTPEDPPVPTNSSTGTFTIYYFVTYLIALIQGDTEYVSSKLSGESCGFSKQINYTKLCRQKLYRQTD